MTTAYRSKLWLERYGWTAAVVEHRRGKFRYDLWGVADVVALPPAKGGTGALFVQAYLDQVRRDDEKEIEQINAEGEY